MDTINQHRTIRKFLDKRVTDKLLNSIIESGCRASTTGNMQLYSVVVTRERENIKQLAPYHFNQNVAKNAAVLLTVCADFYRFSKWCKLNNAEPGYDNFLSFITALIDAVLFAQNLCIAAEDKGLGICYLGTTIYNSEEVSEILRLPELVVPVTTIALGWPAEVPEQSDRLSVTAIIHNECYQDYSNETIQNIYRFKENLAESVQYIKENNKETLAQVFTDIRYKKEDNEYFSQKFLKTIQKQGYNL